MEPNEGLKPQKKINICCTCNRSPMGHLRTFRNIAMKATKKKYSSLVNILDIQISSTEKLYICDRCLQTIDRVCSMREVIHKNFEGRIEQPQNCLQQERSGLVSVELSKHLTMSEENETNSENEDMTVKIEAPKSSRCRTHIYVPSVKYSHNQTEAKSCDHSYSTIPNLPVEDIYFEHQKKTVSYT